MQNLEEKFTKYEIARILGARSLQLAMGAPILLKLTPEEEDDLNFDNLKISERELNADVLPITVKRPLPKKSEKEVKKLTEEEIKEKIEKEKTAEETEKQKEKIEEKEEKEIQEEGEIMQMAQPEDEAEENLEESKEEI